VRALIRTSAPTPPPHPAPLLRHIVAQIQPPHPLPPAAFERPPQRGVGGRGAGAGAGVDGDRGEPAGAVAAAVARDQEHGAAPCDLGGVEAAPALIGGERQDEAAARLEGVEPGGGRMGSAGSSSGQ
jgi:hypothetical protein